MNIPVPKLGQILIQRKKIAPKQLEHALTIQKKQKQQRNFIGEILIKLGFVQPRDVAAALVIQSGLPYIAVNKYTLDSNLVRMIPYDIACKEKVIVLDRIGDILSVVMASPLTSQKKKHLELMTQCRIATFISTAVEIDQAIERYYTDTKELHAPL